MRRIHILVLAALAVLVPAVPAAAQVQGAYTLTHVEGRALPAPSPDEDNVTVHAAALLLQEDASYTFALQSRIGDASPVEHREATGTYRVEGDTLFLEMSDGSDPIALTFTLEADGRLTLRVPAGFAYTFQRQQRGPP